jgi:putative ABC transport system ATP-binding protein
MTERAADVLLRADRVTKLYLDGHVLALGDVSFSLHRAEYVAVMGPSGSGKSTLLNVLGALDRPTSGEVYFEGQALGAMPSLDRYRNRKLGFVFQSFQLLPVLTALENVQVPMLECVRSDAQRVARARALLDNVGLTRRARHLPKHLSMGERQRVAIARALANDPPLLLADEPTGNLDTFSARGIMRLFTDLRYQHGVSILMVTHDPQLAAEADRILQMRDGRLVEP